MQPDTLEIRPDIRAGLHALAEKTHRAEADMLNEALSIFLERERQAIARTQSESYQSTQALIDRIKNRRANRDIGDFDIREAIEEGRD
jgi:predicted transcriptional regulator